MDCIDAEAVMQLFLEILESEHYCAIVQVEQDLSMVAQLCVCLLEIARDS